MEDSTESQAEKSDSLHANDGLNSSFAGLKKKKKHLVLMTRKMQREYICSISNVTPVREVIWDYICDEFDLWLDSSSKEFNCLSLPKVVYMGLVGLWL
ncbi:hypothetical protein F2Q69_00002186 [Brassica cretica]|uniref:Uncharacterized protein n=1 Tax=Brassica cretica TaxID=69181 RepID=A0A8S9NZ03_BRACR|nr:hypothetical protein F2Q69_00002186 [Brassica cretica]